ncbi:citrate lyase acyl carrier protein [Sulfurospirillum arcachonense]|uniref:citrate lyase acyl carrier protein n=1 Tax=Sulfurospirillum arcachonense TaxID=57666 RepID=UPI000469535C|nr:citrate lyase acyl carrier protein [Sulfurospirillum arcachonense]
MNILKKSAYAGTLESSDAYIHVSPIQENEIKLILESSVEEIYGEAIEELVVQTLKEMKINNILVKVQDKGALDFVIKARLQAAILRACESNEPVWEELS